MPYLFPGGTPHPAEPAAVQRAIPDPTAVSAGVQLHEDPSLLLKGAGAADAGVPEADERHEHRACSGDGLQRLRSYGACGAVHVHVFQGGLRCNPVTAACVGDRRSMTAAVFLGDLKYCSCSRYRDRTSTYAYAPRCDETPACDPSRLPTVCSIISCYSLHGSALVSSLFAWCSAISDPNSHVSLIWLWSVFTLFAGVCTGAPTGRIGARRPRVFGRSGR